MQRRITPSRHSPAPVGRDGTIRRERTLTRASACRLVDNDEMLAAVRSLREGSESEPALRESARAAEAALVTARAAAQRAEDGLQVARSSEADLRATLSAERSAHIALAAAQEATIAELRHSVRAAQVRCCGQRCHVAC